MVVTYKLAPITYWLAKRMVKLDFFSLVNLIAERGVVPELLQHEVTCEAVAGELYSLLTDATRKQKMKLDLAEVRKKLGARGASGRAAEAVLEMLG
jgi:lipid-A-disaccharide synthase